MVSILDHPLKRRGTDLVDAIMFLVLAAAQRFLISLKQEILSRRRDKRGKINY